MLVPTLEDLMRRRARLFMLTSLLGLAMLAPAGRASAASDRLPDLAMAKLQNIVTDQADGRRLLRFSAIIVNVGSGPMEVRSQRPNTSSSWSSQQVIYDDAGGSRTVATPAVDLIYGGDGHNHWHVEDLESYSLVSWPSGTGERLGKKAGFCFFDNYQYKLSLPGAPQAAQYPRTVCGNRFSRTLRHGLSVGWGDKYQWSLPDQYIDTTGLPNGTYRLWATADQADFFQESNNANNSTWADLRIDANGVTVLRRAPNP
jgi:Lysyl oxidase